MKKLTVRLKNGSKKKKYKAPKKVNLQAAYISMNLEKEIHENTDKLSVIEKSITFICSVFGHQFNEEDLLRGLEHDEILPLANKCALFAREQMRVKNAKRIS